ncbi:MAG TPA: hypothetical protein VHX17_07815 [Candidatus Cybelea sp.]|jgi:hypothetical protein|nr:hypothetical protein [Candidatus Cybelea sp.]
MSARSIGIGVVAGLCGAVLIDLYLIVSEPWVARHVTALLVMQWDASNLLGAAAYRGGWVTAAFGTLLHFCVSIVWGILFVFIVERVARLREHALFAGVLLGIVAMAVMRLVIHFGHAVVRPFPSAGMFLYNLIAHVVFFGIPVALVATNMLAQRVDGRRIRV